MNRKPIYIGVMTGNSMDAADAVAVEFTQNKYRLLASACEPIPMDLANTLRTLAENENINVVQLLQATNDLSKICANAVNQLNADITCTIVGCHGQTIAHRPAMQATWQLLNGALLASLIGMDVICDFRSRDLVEGGEGAPFAPLFHQHVFSTAAPCDVVNIGGIANITHLSEDGSVHGYDTGPGMILMDSFYQRHHQGRYDANGELAAQGNTYTPWLNSLLQHPFFRRQPPKSCGREDFTLAALTLPDISTADIQATLLALTAQTIADAVRSTHVYLCGGGAKNTALISRLKILKPNINWQLTDAAGIPTEQMEAAVFAWLAKMHNDGQKIVTDNITGGKAHIAGTRYPA